MTSDEFRAWLNTPEHGECCIYFRGVLAETVETNPDVIASMDESLKERALKVRALWKATQAASDAGLVYLVQRRRGERDYEYIARRAKQ